MSALRTLASLKRHSKRVGGHFFNPRASESLSTVSIEGIYRQPLSELAEGYVVTVADLDGGNGHAYVYRFQAGPDSLEWWPIGWHESLASAEAFLRSMGATK
jgi:hypothetical protein